MRRLLLLAAVIPVPALGQEGASATATSTGPDIVVTGRGLDTPPGDAAFDVVTIGREELQANASQRLESVLADVAGLQQFRRSDSRSANPTSQGISLRGIGGNASSRALLVFDGVPQADPFGGYVPFPAYALSRLGQVRVTRGGGSGYYGPGALAGTVELESAAPDELAPLAAHADYGSRDAIEAAGTAALVRDGGFATLAGAYARGDGFTPTVREDRGVADRPAPYEQASGAIRGVVRVAARTEVQASVAGFTDRRNRGTDFTDNKSEGADASVRIIGRGRWGYSLLAYLQTRAFASSFASVDEARETATQVLDQYNTPATGIGARVEVRPPVGERATLRAGADIRDVSGRTEERYLFAAGVPTRGRQAGGSSETWGLFADGSVEVGALTLTAGGRVDLWDITDGFLIERPFAGVGAVNASLFPDRHGTQTTGRAGLAYRVGAAMTLRAAGYRGWRLPTLNELYRPFRVGNDTTLANAALDPESLTGYEAGVTLAPLAGVSLAATFFRNRLDDAIANVTLVTTATSATRQRQNLDAIIVTGAEIDARYAVGAFSLAASYSHTDPRVRATGLATPLNGLRPAQTPRDQVSASLGWRRDGAVLSTTLRHVSHQFDDDQNTRTLAPATTLDAYAALPLAHRVAIEARGENLFDERVEAGISGADVVERASPRTVWIGLRYAM